MILITLLLLLALNFGIHISSLILYIKKKENRYIRWFANSAIINISLAGIITIYIIYNPGVLRGINISRILWLLSGFIMFIMLVIKIVLFRRIYRRAKDPENFHYNFFGKKVLHEKVMTKTEFYIFFFTIPFFLLFGSYFVVKIINFFMYGADI